MNDLIFHQYPMSPFSEKVRKVFAFKALDYKEVEQPAWMPKPNLTPLTGGYRRIPVMQIGADIYCDSALIIRKIEELHPSPSVFPDDSRTAAEGVAAWADGIFFRTAVPMVFSAMAEFLPKELFEDRQKMIPGMSKEVLEILRPNARGNFRGLCERLNADLEGRPWILGSSFSVADAAVYHCLWFARNAPEAAEEIRERPLLAGWMQRIDSMGKGSPHAMTAAEALQIATDSQPAPAAADADTGAYGLELGRPVAVHQDDLPSDVFQGNLYAAGPEEVVLERNDAALGKLALHFPRTGFTIRAL